MVRKFIMSTIAAAAVAVGATAEAKSQAETLGVQQLVFKDAAGLSLPYCQSVEGKDLPGRYALVIFLHGAGERGTDNVKQLIHGVPQLLSHVRNNKEKVVVIVPQCPTNEQWVSTPWDRTSHTMPEKPSAPMTAAMELIDSKVKEFDVDTNRIYVTGISMGGYGTWDILCRRPNFFAASVAVCGGADTAQAPKLKHLPIQIFHGDNDTVVPTVRSRNMFKALKDAGADKVDYHEIYQCGHNSWSPAYNDSMTWTWLFRQKKSTCFKLFCW